MKTMKSRAMALSVMLAVVVCAFSAQASDKHVAPMKQLAQTKVKALLASPEVVNAVKAQNAANAGLDEAAIIALDKKWRAEKKAGSGDLIGKVMGNDLSGFLKKAKESAGGLYTEIFVMDDKGLNVGQSDGTSDYWQGDEAKWQETYPKGADAVHISEVEEDGGKQVSQLSAPVVDPATGKNIGAATIGIDVSKLK